jgi:hypothetical protein
MKSIPKNRRVVVGGVLFVALLAAVVHFTGALRDAGQLMGRIPLRGGSPSGAPGGGAVCTAPAGPAAVGAYALALTNPASRLVTPSSRR